MPLKRGSSRKVVSENIAELHKGKVHQKTEEKYGKAKADAQSIAIAISKSKTKTPKKSSRRS